MAYKNYSEVMKLSLPEIGRRVGESTGSSEPAASAMASFRASRSSSALAVASESSCCRSLQSSSVKVIGGRVVCFQEN